MNIHEHQAKQILKKYGAAVPNGIFGFSTDEIVEKAKRLNTKKYVLKAQIHAGGRGKAGGVKLVKNIDIHIEEVIDIQILDQIRIQTKQPHLFSNLFICDGKNSFCRKKLQITHQLGHKGFAKIIHCKISHPQLMLRMSKRINGAILPGKISQVIFTGPSDLEDCIIELDTIQSLVQQ